jgi:hypothetical protein
MYDTLIHGYYYKVGQTDCKWVADWHRATEYKAIDPNVPGLARLGRCRKI